MYDEIGTEPCAAANPATASRLQPLRPVRRVDVLGSFAFCWQTRADNGVLDGSCLAPGESGTRVSLHEN